MASTQYITLEEHFLSSDIELQSIYQGESGPFDKNKLQDLEGVRLESMTTNKIKTQVISHVPAYGRDYTARECSAINDQLAGAVARQRGRLAGFATLPMDEPGAAVAELERCVGQHGFVGSLVDNTLVDGSFYDAPRFRPVFAAHERLDVPIYLHPTFPSEAVSKLLYAGENISKSAEFYMGIAGFGWHAMTALHVLRLFAAGVFDEFPRLKLVIGHDGELLPFNLARTSRPPLKLWGENLKRTLLEVWDENVWVTTSGMWSLDPLRCLLGCTRKDRIMFSVDYPFSTNEVGTQFMQELKESGLVNEEEFEMIASGNARKLLKLS